MSQKILTLILTLTLIIFVVLIYAIHRRFEELSIHFITEKEHWAVSFKTLDSNLTNMSDKLAKIETTSQELIHKTELHQHEIIALKSSQQSLEQKLTSDQKTTKESIKDFLLSMDIFERKINNLHDGMVKVHDEITATQNNIDILSEDSKNIHSILETQTPEKQPGL